LGRKFREHGLMLFLDGELYHAFSKLQADKCLGRSYAGLRAFTEGIYHLGYISKDSYEAHVERYEVPLYEEESKPLPKELIKCDFCGKSPVVAILKEKVTGFEKKCCSYHAENLTKHPKWERVP